MPELAQQIRPGVGLGALVLGASEQSVRDLLGVPHDVSEKDFGDGVNVRAWTYRTLGLELWFSEDDGYRLGVVQTRSPRATLNGTCIIGLAEEALVAGNFDGLGPPVLDDDFEESGRDYVWRQAELSCWVTAGTVTSVSIFPLYDETGNNPQWPDDVV